MTVFFVRCTKNGLFLVFEIRQICSENHLFVIQCAIYFPPLIYLPFSGKLTADRSSYSQELLIMIFCLVLPSFESQS